MLNITNIRKTLFVITGSREVASVNVIRDALAKKLGVAPIDLYDCQFEEYKRYGFMNHREKQDLYDMGKLALHARASVKLSRQGNVILSGEFAPIDQDWLYAVKHTYGHDIFIIKCRETDFDKAYQSYADMVTNITEYNKPRFADKYIYETLYIPSVVIDDVSKDLWRFSYDAALYTQLHGDKVIDGEDFLKEVM